jgi:hypothetical protein
VIRVKFRPGSPSTFGEKVASGLVWRFGTFDCISDNLACFKDGFGNRGSFLDVGSHRFYVAKPFPEEVTDVLDPLSDGGSSCSESSDLGAMVEVMALGDEEGGDSPRPARQPLEHLLPQEQDAPNVSVVDLRTPLNHVIDSARISEALERTRLILLGKVAEDEDAQRQTSTVLYEFHDAHGGAPVEFAHDPRRGHGLAAMGPGQIQRSPSASQGRGGRRQGGRALSCNA